MPHSLILFLVSFVFYGFCSFLNFALFLAYKFSGGGNYEREVGKTKAINSREKNSKGN